MITRFMRNASRLPAYATYFLLAYMPFHIFLSQSLSLITGGLSVWKLGKDALLALAVVFAVILVYRQKKATKAFNVLVAGSMLYALIHLIVWMLNPDIYKQTALLGTLYNNRVVWFVVLGMGASLLTPKYLNESNVIKLVVGVGTVVAFLGVLQYFLPKDLLTHFGYNLQRGVKPAFFIDDKPDLPRIMSTLRDPNSLAAYLIIPICLSISLFIKRQKRQLVIGGILILQFLALFLTFSRGGWMGVIVAVSALTLLQFRTFIRKHILTISIVIIAVVISMGIFGYMQRDQYVVQNIILHSDESTKAKEDSNALHLRLAKDGAIAIVKKPLGHGPGTAGIVSIQNPKGGVLTENYYVQIGYEVGIIGLLLFVSIWGYVLFLVQKNRGILATTVLASAVAYIVLGLIMHIWTNESVAAQWWLLAGLVLGVPIKVRTKQ